VVSINIPDDVLLAIFDFYAESADEGLFAEKKRIEAWQSLVHVCQQWRSLVFASPHRLNLRLVCKHTTCVRDTLDVWPPLPLLIWYTMGTIDDVDNIIAALEHSDRVCQISLVNVPRLDKALAVMQKPFSELTDLQLNSYITMPVLPDSFLGGSAPRLRKLQFEEIIFPGLPKLLLSATHLVCLTLKRIPHSGYISPEAIVTTLSMLTNLERLGLGFQSPRSHPDRASRRPPPRTRSVLPALTHLWFKGVSEYMDDLVARIDVPRLDELIITFFNQIVFDTPQLPQFISRTPKLKALKKARVAFEDDLAEVKLSSPTFDNVWLFAKVSCRELDWQLSSLEQVCTSCLPPLSALEDLYFYIAPSNWPDNIENMLLLELLHPFSAVKNLYLSTEVARHIVPALQELVGGRTTEVLPSLQNIFLERLESSGPDQEGIGKLVSVRQLSGHPVAVSRWERNNRTWI
jgi:hypothetical protein